MEKFFRDYKIDRNIGNGSYGQVYRIIREEFGHTYEAALKVIELPKDFSEVEKMRREGLSKQNVTEYYQNMVDTIVREFELMSKLKGNSYIVSYEDHKVIEKKDEFGWKIYIQMELLTPLMEYVENKGMSYHDVLQLGINICKALELCQKHKIVHRDIKPENIFVSSTGNFKLGDFGIARQLEQTSGDYSQKGTQNYMAPEIFRSGHYDSTVDIYSLGIVLYRFFNGNRMPFMPLTPAPIHFSDKEYALSKRLAGETMPKPTNASEKLTQIILKACAFTPTERYQEPRELREALEEVLYEEKNEVLLTPLKKESFPEKLSYDLKPKQNDEMETVLLLKETTSESVLDKTKKDSFSKTQKLSEQDKTLPISMSLSNAPLLTPQEKMKKLKVLVGVVVLAIVFIVTIHLILLSQSGNSEKGTIPQMDTATPKMTETPVSTIVETPKTTAIPKIIRKTKIPKVTTKVTVTVAPIVTTEPTVKVVTEIPQKAGSGNAQEVINVKPKEEQEIIIK